MHICYILFEDMEQQINRQTSPLICLLSLSCIGPVKAIKKPKYRIYCHCDNDLIYLVTLSYGHFCLRVLNLLKLANCIKFANNSTHKNYNWRQNFAYLEKKIFNLVSTWLAPCGLLVSQSCQSSTSYKMATV